MLQIQQKKSGKGCFLWLIGFSYLTITLCIKHTANKNGKAILGFADNINEVDIVLGNLLKEPVYIQAQLDPT
jgi:hypothetical protein